MRTLAEYAADRAWLEAAKAKPAGPCQLVMATIVREAGQLVGLDVAEDLDLPPGTEFELVVNGGSRPKQWRIVPATVEADGRVRVRGEIPPHATVARLRLRGAP